MKDMIEAIYNQNSKPALKIIKIGQKPVLTRI